MREPSCRKTFCTDLRGVLLENTPEKRESVSRSELSAGIAVTDAADGSLLRDKRLLTGAAQRL